MLGVAPISGQPRCALGRVVVLEVVPPYGAQLGGDTRDVRGLNFASSATVTFGKTACPVVTFVDRTKLTVTTPPSDAPYLDDVEVANSTLFKNKLHSAYDRLQVGAIVSVNPATLPNSSYFLDYPGVGGLWSSLFNGQADTGDIYFDRTLQGDDFPTAGTAVNGYTPAVFDGVSQALDTGNRLSSYVYGGDILDLGAQPTSAAGFTMFMLVWFDSAAAPSGTPWYDPGPWGDETAYPILGMSYSTSGVAAVGYDVYGAGFVSVTMACSTGAWHLVVMRCSATQMKLRIDGSESPSPATYSLDNSSSQMGAGSPVAIGKNPYRGFQAMKLLGVGFYGRQLSDTECDGIGTFLQAKFALPLGFVATSQDPTSLSRSQVWLASYLGSNQPWVGTKRTVNGNGNQLNNGIFGVPGTSTLNGLPTATFSNTAPIQGFAGKRLTKDIIGVDEGGYPITYNREFALGWTMNYICKFNTLPNSGGVAYVGAPLFGDTNAIVGLSVSSDTGVQAYQIDDLSSVADYKYTPGVLLSTGTWACIQARWTGVNRLEARLIAGGTIGAWQPTLVRPVTYPTNAGHPWVGINYSTTIGIDGEIASLLWSQRCYTTYTLDGVGFYLQQRYAQAFGFPVGGAATAQLKQLSSSGAGTYTSAARTGTATAVLSSLVAALSGGETFSGTFSGVALKSLSAAAVAAEAFTGSASCAVQPLVAAASGAEAFSGSGTCAASPLVCSATGAELFTGTSSGVALKSLSSAASGGETFAGAVAAALQSLSSALAGSELFTGTSSGVALKSLSSSAAGAEAFSGTASASLSPLVAASAGFSGYIGSVSCALQPLSAAGAGAEAFSGTFSGVALKPVVLSASGAELFTGTSTCAVQPLVCTATGAEGFTGTGSCALQPLSAAGSALETFAGAAVAALSALSAAGTGPAQAFASTSVSIALKSLAAAAAGLEAFSGSGSGALTPLDALGFSSAITNFTGTAAGSMSPLSAAGVGSELFTGIASAALQALSALATGAEAYAGAATLALAHLEAAGVAAERFTGTGSVALSTLSAAGFGGGFVPISGSSSAALSPLIVAAAGSERFSGSGSAVFAPLASSGSGAEAYAGAASLAFFPLVGTAAGTNNANLSGSATAALAAFVSVAVGGELVTGDAALDLAPLESSASAELRFEGDGAVDLSGFLLDATGTYVAAPVTGVAALDLSRLRSSASGGGGFFGAAHLALAPLSAALTGYFLKDLPPPGVYHARVLGDPTGTRARALTTARTTARLLLPPRVTVRFKK